MNSYFDQLDLEMIALESAIGAFEVENGITDEYLNDYSTDYSARYATESIGSDDFGFGLFDDILPATEAADEAPKKGGIGAGIKNIMSAVGRFFIKVKDGIVSFFQSFKNKKAQAKDPKVSPEAEKVANNLRGAIKTAITIIGNVTKEDTGFMKRLCQDISASITAANVNAGMLNTGKNRTDEKRDEDFARVGAQFVEKSGGEGHESDADERIQRGLDILEKVKKTQQDLDDALNKVSDLFKAEIRKVKLVESAYDDRAEKRRGETDYQNAERGAKYDAEDEKALRAHSDAVSKRSGVIVNGETATSARGISRSNLKNQVRQVIFSDISLTDVQTICNEVVSACSTHAAFCKQVAEKNIEGSSENSKRAYKLCKILNSASTIYTKISGAITELTSGSIFTDGNDNYGSVTTRRNTGNKDEQDFINE